MTRYLIDAMGFNDAVRLVAALVTITSIFSLIFSTPNPAHVHPRPQSYRALKTWVDTDAFRNKAFVWFTAAVAFLFFGFYPVFFNLEEVRLFLLCHGAVLTGRSGQQCLVTEPEMVVAPLSVPSYRIKGLFRPSGFLPL